MESMAAHRRNHMSRAFAIRLQACYHTGERVHIRPLFRQKHILAYKVKSREEAENMHARKAKTTDNDSATSATHKYLTSRPDFADQSTIDFHPKGTTSHNFYHSWPLSVTLKSDKSETNTKWKAKLRSKHCPFCYPLGKCNDVKDLVDHLETYHPDFTYATRQGKKRVVVEMKQNREREKNVDPMFIVGCEGYIISSKKRKKSPYYCDIARRHQPGYPFTLWKAPIPEGYGGYIPGAPGTVDAERFNARARKQRSNQFKKINLNRRIGKEEGNTNGGQQIPRQQNKPPKPPSLKRPRTSCSALLLTPQSLFCDMHSQVSNLFNTLDEQQFLQCERKSTRSCMHAVQNISSGVNNSHTEYLPSTALGEHGTATITSFQNGTNLFKGSEVAGSRLVNTITNNLLDVKPFQNEHDCLDIESVRCRSNLSEIHNLEFFDLFCSEKYFLSRWNQFIAFEFLCDEDVLVFSTLMQFINDCFAEMKSTNVKSILVSFVHRCWSHGYLHTNDVFELLSEFSPIDVSHLCGEYSHRRLLMTQRFAREVAEHLQLLISDAYEYCINIAEFVHEKSMRACGSRDKGK